MPLPLLLPATVKDLLRAFLAYLRLNRNASAHTVRAYDGDLSQFTTYMAAELQRPRPELQPADITRPMIRGFLADLFRRGESRASAARKLAAVRTFLRYLKREGLIEADPGLLVVTPKSEQKIPRHLEVDEMVRLLETPDVSGPLGRRDRAILELLYASGLRLSELVALDLEDVNLGSRMVRVMGKGRKERLVPFNRSAADALRAWLADRETLLTQREATGGPRAAGSQQRIARGQKKATAGRTTRAESVPPGARGRLSQLPRHPAVVAARASPRAPLRRGVQRPVRHQPPRHQALVRHPPARGRRGPAGHSGAARARAAGHDATVHARERGAVDGCVSSCAPEGERQ